MQILKTDRGLQIFREFVDGFLAFPRAIVQHFDFDRKPLADVTHSGGIPWTTPALSPALIGIGYIIGPALSSITLRGRRDGVVGAHPAAAVLRPRSSTPPRRRRHAPWDVVSYSVWYNVVRPIAVGTMLVGACHTLFSMRELHRAFACAALSPPPAVHTREADRAHRARHTRALGACIGHRGAAGPDYGHLLLLHAGGLRRCIAAAL